jgi:hypothetical protein
MPGKRKHTTVQRTVGNTIIVNYMEKFCDFSYIYMTLSHIQPRR